MELVDEREFGRLTADGRPCGHYDFSLYYGLTFRCACGLDHEFRPWMEILHELPLLRFVVICPEGFHVVVLKARWVRSRSERTLETDLGSKLSERWQGTRGIEFQAGYLEARTGRRWSLEETATLMEQQHGLAILMGEEEDLP